MHAFRSCLLFVLFISSLHQFSFVFFQLQLHQVLGVHGDITPDQQKLPVTLSEMNTGAKVSCSTGGSHSRAYSHQEQQSHRALHQLEAVYLLLQQETLCTHTEKSWQGFEDSMLTLMLPFEIQSINIMERQNRYQSRYTAVALMELSIVPSAGTKWFSVSYKGQMLSLRISFSLSLFFFLLTILSSDYSCLSQVQ